MSEEAQVRSALQIQKGKLDYSSKPTAFMADVSGTNGPSPGAVTVATTGTDIDFYQLTTPALCRIMNLDSTNRVDYGIYDPETVKYYPFGELLAGESFVIRLSRDLQQEYGTGTGTTGANTNRLHFRAENSAVNVLVEAFEA